MSTPELPIGKLPPDPLEIPLDQALLDAQKVLENPREMPDEDFNLWISYLLQYWGFFILYIVDPHVPALEGPPSIIPVDGGFPIYDYGNYLATSPGEELLLTHDSTMKLLTTVSNMIQLAVDAGAREVAFSGHEIAKRKAWFDLEFHKDSTLVINFTPEFKEQALLQNAKRLEPIYGQLRHEPKPWTAPSSPPSPAAGVGRGVSSTEGEKGSEGGSDSGGVEDI